MKNPNNFIKRYWLAISIVVFIGILIAYISMRYMHTKPKDPITSLVQNKITEFKDKLKEENARVITNKTEAISGISLEEYNKLKARYDSNKIDFEAFTNVNATLRDSLNMALLTIDDLNNKIWNWENIKPSGSTIKATMNEKDSVLHTEIDVKLHINDVVQKGGLFKKDKFYTDFYSPDQNIKINGVQTYRKEIVLKPKRIGLGLQLGYGFTGEGKATPYVGIGASFNLINL